jgi:hypothetical protein
VLVAVRSFVTASGDDGGAVTIWSWSPATEACAAAPIASMMC